MDGLRQLWLSAPDDPLVLAGWFFALWLPLCALGLGLLALLATAQYRMALRRRPRPVFAIPPLAIRPLVGRRYISRAPSGHRARAALAVARLSLAVLAVLAFTALALAASGAFLLRGLSHPWGS